MVAESFCLLQDPALRQLAAPVHCIDVGALPDDAAPGLEMLIRGPRPNTRRMTPAGRFALPAFDACTLPQTPHDD